MMLDNKIQTTNEPIVNDLVHIKAICKKMNPNMKHKLSSNIIQGLQPEICENIIIMDNTTIQLKRKKSKINCCFKI